MADHIFDWPGERQPSHTEIERAHQIAEPTVQQEFKRALLASRIAQTQQSRPTIVLDDGLLQSSVDDVEDDFVKPTCVTSTGIGMDDI